jgi:hypothetical protein
MRKSRYVHASREVAVQVAQRWILARLHNEMFFSLEALNARIAELLEELNARPMRSYGGASRHELFERLDRPALRPLNPTRFEVAEWGPMPASIATTTST